MFFLLVKDIKFSLYSLYYTKACNKFEGTHLRVIAPRQYSFFQRNVEAVASRWQDYVRFDWPEIWTLDLPLQRQTRYHSTNWPVLSKILHLISAASSSFLPLYLKKDSSSYQYQTSWIYKHYNFFNRMAFFCPS